MDGHILRFMSKRSITPEKSPSRMTGAFGFARDAHLGGTRSAEATSGLNF